VSGTIPRPTGVAALAVILIAQLATASSNALECRAAGPIVRLRDLPEASGIAASRRTPGTFWAHNDSGEPVLFAIDARGTVKGRVRVTGASVNDWEDIDAGPCPHGSCLYIADIGDNSGRRKHVTLYRVAEPKPGDDATAAVETFHATYPDRPQNAEALFVTNDGDVFLITKGDPGDVVLFRFPRPLTSSTTMQMQRVGEPIGGAKIEGRDRPTGAALSPDGQWVAVRTTHWIAFHRASDLLAGRWRDVFRADVSGLGEPRGEGVTFAAGDTVVLVGEAGGSLPGSGTFARLACTFGQP
jgi:hypothetical protein